MKKTRTGLVPLTHRDLWHLEEVLEADELENCEVGGYTSRAHIQRTKRLLRLTRRHLFELGVATGKETREMQP